MDALAPGGGEIRYQGLLASLDDGFCEIEVLFDSEGRPHDYRFIEANPAFQRHTGLENAVGKTIQEMVPNHDAHWVETYGRVAITGVPERLREEAVALGRCYDVFAFRMGEAAERRVGVLFRDISEQNRAEMALRESAARQGFLVRLEDALRPIADPSEIQFEASRILGVELRADRAGYAETLEDEDSVRIGRHFTSGIPSVEGTYQLSVFGSALRERLLSGKPVTHSDAAEDPDLTAAEKAAFAALPLRGMADIPLVKRGRLLAILFVHFREAHAFSEFEIGLMQAVAERTWAAVERARAEQALRESEERYRLLVDSSADAILLSQEDGSILSANPEATRMFGASEEELRALGREGLVDADDPRVGAALEVRTRTGRWRGELTMRRRDGSRFPAEVSSLLFSDSSGARRTSIVVRDISERKRAEEARAELQQQLAQAQKMESIGRLAGGVAHDFNNLLTVISGYGQMILSDLREDDPMRSGLKEICDAGERASALTQQLLAYSRKQILNVRCLETDQTIDKMRSMLARLVGEDVMVEFRLRAAGASILADPHQLEQVVMNLAVNARDAMPNGGRLTIETRQANRAEPFHIQGVTAPAGRYVALSVTDTGQGISDEVKARIFEPFFTTKEVGRGTGLGLSMVQGIIAQSGGFIDVESQPGKGTRFEILLPVSVSEAVDAPVPAGRAGLRGEGSILVVEDEASVRKFVVSALRRHGYHVLPASSAEEALRVCSGAADDIDMVLTDIVMPEGSGADLIATLKKRRPRMRCVYMSGYSDDVISRHGVLNSGVDFIPKPFTPGDLLSKIREVLEREE